MADPFNKPHGYLAAAYCQLVPVAQEIARPLGYAIAVHGSMHNDLDLVAVPWSDDAVPAHEVYEAIAKLCSPYADESRRRPIYGPEKKPHGRVAWIIPLMGGAGVDLSVLPRSTRKLPLTPVEIAQLAARWDGEIHGPLAQFMARETERIFGIHDGTAEVACG